jgi:transcriptional regulator with XRE-family HTH domain
MPDVVTLLSISERLSFISHDASLGRTKRPMKVKATETTTVPRITPNGIDEYVGGRLRTRRLMLGVTQETLAEALELTVEQIQKYETGSSPILVAHLFQLTEILQVPGPTFFFEGAPRTKDQRYASPPSSVHFLLNFPTALDDYAFLRAYLHIKSPAVRRGLIAIVQALANDDC